MEIKFEDNGVCSLTPDAGKRLVIKDDTDILFEKVYLGDTENLEYYKSFYIEVDKPEPQEVVNE